MLDHFKQLSPHYHHAFPFQIPDGILLGVSRIVSTIMLCNGYSSNIPATLMEWINHQYPILSLLKDHKPLLVIEDASLCRIQHVSLCGLLRMVLWCLSQPSSDM